MSEQARKLMCLFKGLDRAYGTYQVTGHREDKKVTGRAVTKKGDVTVELWEKHINGEQGLGIVPINDDNVVHFGAIDIDFYSGINYTEVYEKIIKHNLPLVMCRSKSGGLHLYCFISEPVEAKLMRSKLQEWASFLGYGVDKFGNPVEIFPKQVEILSERGDIGQWINMPYFNAENTDRPCLAPDPLPLEQFLTYAFNKRISKKTLEDFTLEITGVLDEGPPCLQHLITQGFPEGTRNNGLFNLSVYARKAYPDAWKERTNEFNYKYMDPPLNADEVQTIIKSASRKNYFYTCDTQPIKAFCNQGLCKKRKFGVGDAADFLPELGTLTKLDTSPPIWFWDVGDGRIELVTEDLQSPRRFQKRCMDVLNIMPPVIKMEAWRKIVHKAMGGVVIIEAPSDSSAVGQLWAYIEKFCTSKNQAMDRDSILQGKPYTDKESNKTYFRMIDLLEFLERHKFREFKPHQITATLKNAGAESKFLNLKGKGVNVWVVEAFKKPDEPKLDTEVFKDEYPF